MNKADKKKKFRLINGTKGAVSLFLAVLMTPFLTIAMLLVEVGRYNSAVSILDEAMGTSAISLMANYDPYLHDRWGLLAITQAKDPNALYGEYLESNLGVMGGALSLNSAVMNGAMPLSDTEILTRQILEYSKLNAPVTLASSFLNLSSLLGVFEGLNNVDKYLKVVTTGNKIASAAIELEENIDKLKESADKLEGYKTDYDTKYSTFESTVNDLIGSLGNLDRLKADKKVKDEELATLRQELEDLLAEEAKNKKESDSTEESQAVKNKREEISKKEQEITTLNEDIEEEKGKISSKRSSATTAKDEYATLLGNIASELGNYNTLMGDTNKALQDMQSNVLSGIGQVMDIATILQDKEGKKKELQGELSKLDPSSKEYADKKAQIDAVDREITDLKLEKGLYDTVKEGITTMDAEWGKTVDEYNESAIALAISGFTELKNKVSSLNLNNLTSSSAKITQAEYKYPKVTGYTDSEGLDKYIEEQENNLKKGSFIALLKGLGKMYEKVMSLDGLFENDLDAYINTSYYNTNLSGLPGGLDAQNPIVTFIQKMADTITSLINCFDIKDKSWKEIWNGFKEVFTNAEAAFNALKDAVLGPIRKITQILTTGYESIYLTTYGAYMLPCRTDYDDVNNSPSMSTMTGYSLEAEAFPSKDSAVDLPIAGDFMAIVNTVTSAIDSMNDPNGGDVSFRGAELEYFLAGTNSELANQALTFLELYVLRFVCCLPAISGNTEVLALANSAGAATLGIGTPVIMAFYYVLEPLVQTVLLCNGSSVAFIPTTLYLTPSGLPTLLSELCSLCKLSDADKKALETSMVEGFGAEKSTYEAEKKKLEDKKNQQSGGNTGNTSEKSKLEKRFDSYKQGLLSFNYREYCFMIALVFLENKVMSARLANLIQMETHYYYKQQQAAAAESGEYSFVFDLYKSYTFVDATADVRVEQILPSLTDSSLFELSRQNYRGY